MSHPIFIISGMPRARTAWVANYLSNGSTLCVHEGMSICDSPADCARWLLDESKSRAIGICDSGAVRFQDALSSALPGAKWVIIRRKISESESSFESEHGIQVDLWEHKRKVDDAILYRSPLVVDFDEIDARIIEIARYCVPDWVHDERRHDMLLTLNVQLTKEALAAGIKSVAASFFSVIAEPPKFTPAMLEAEAIANEALKDEPFAALWWRQLSDVVDVYDHTIDGDGRDVEKTHRAFKAMTLSWPVNPFLTRYGHVLVPVMSAALSAWQHGPKAKAADIYTEVINALIFLIHGQSGVERWMPRFRELHQIILAEDARKDGD